MIDAKELRIGNYVNTENGIKRVSDISVDRKCFFLEPHVKPIPLTEEWLIKFGFEKHANKVEVIYRLGVFEYATSCKTIDLEFEGLECSITHTTNIKHVHQLQNLYHSLTGEELKLQEVKPFHCVKEEKHDKCKEQCKSCSDIEKGIEPSNID